MKGQLLTVEEVNGWTGKKRVDTLRHIPDHQYYDPNFRQLIYVGYKIAVEYGNQYTDALKKNKKIVGEQVTVNIYEWHIKRLFRMS